MTKAQLFAKESLRIYTIDEAGEILQHTPAEIQAAMVTGKLRGLSLAHIRQFQQDRHFQCKYLKEKADEIDRRRRKVSPARAQRTPGNVASMLSFFGVKEAAQ